VVGLSIGEDEKGSMLPKNIVRVNELSASRESKPERTYTYWVSERKRIGAISEVLNKECTLSGKSLVRGGRR